MNQIINIVIRQVVRRLVNLGINKGIDRMSKPGEGDHASPEESAASKQTANRLRQGLQVLRRFGRF